MTLAQFALSVETYCKITGGSVTSWGRTAAHNRAVGGVPDSKHLTFKAADVIHDDPQPSQETRIQVAAMVGLKLITESDHDHLEDPAAA